MFSERESIKRILTVVLEDKVEPILAGLRPLFSRHSGFMFVVDVANRQVRRHVDPSRFAFLFEKAIAC